MKPCAKPWLVKPACSCFSTEKVMPAPWSAETAGWYLAVHLVPSPSPILGKKVYYLVTTAERRIRFPISAPPVAAHGCSRSEKGRNGSKRRSSEGFPLQGCCASMERQCEDRRRPSRFGIGFNGESGMCSSELNWFCGMVWSRRSVLLVQYRQMRGSVFLTSGRPNAPTTYCATSPV